MRRFIKTQKYKGALLELLESSWALPLLLTHSALELTLQESIIPCLDPAHIILLNGTFGAVLMMNDSQSLLLAIGTWNTNIILFLFSDKLS